MTLNPLTIYEIGGLIITVALAIIAYLRSAESAKSQNAAMASVIGVIFTVATGLRFEVIPKIQSAASRLDVIRKDPRRKMLLERIATLGPMVFQDPLMASILKIRMDRIKDEFGQMSRGRFSVADAEMPTFNVQMIGSAKKSVSTTNYVSRSRWWDDPWGPKYEEANEQAVKNGVMVSRIFIFDKPEDMKPALDIMTRQLQHKMKIKYAFLQQLPPFTDDVIIIDSSVVGQHHIVPDKGLNEASFSINPSDVERVTAVLRIIEGNSWDFKP